MKTTIQLSLLLLSLVSFNLAAQTQTCNPNILETAPASRFTINNDGSVTDTQTDLIWARCPQGLSGDGCTGTVQTFAWLNALRETSATSDTQNRDDWRLPNVKELSSLVERRCEQPAINTTVFPNTGNSFFWSASPDASDTNFAWSVGFFGGFVRNDFRSFERRVRLVRGGQ